MSRSPLVVNVADLMRRPASRRRVDVEAPLEEVKVIDSFIPAGALAESHLEVESLSDGLVVYGTVAAPWEGLCRRCLRPLEGNLLAEVRELFSHKPVDEDVYLFSGEQLDLEPMVRDVLLLELPLAPVCRPDCQGLCAVCGADRNLVDCGHDEQPSDARWAGLDALRDLIVDPEPAAGSSAGEGQELEPRGD
ncbi:MAG: hypothetical protein JWL70_2005 [Acidimicrobiia bacterium]|nr:hypothetical protein [Acidimicrobiia bacterium]